MLSSWKLCSINRIIQKRIECNSIGYSREQGEEKTTAAAAATAVAFTFAWIIHILMWSTKEAERVYSVHVFIYLMYERQYECASAPAMNANFINSHF